MRPSLCFNKPIFPIGAAHTDSRTIYYGPNPEHASRKGVISWKYIIFDRYGEKKFVFFATI